MGSGFEGKSKIKDRINKFRNICWVIDVNIRNKIRRTTCIEFCKTITIPILTYCSVMWVISRCTRMKFLRNTLNCNFHDRLGNENIREELGEE